jgi:hypothetical protein
MIKWIFALSCGMRNFDLDTSGGGTVSVASDFGWWSKCCVNSVKSGALRLATPVLKVVALSSFRDW